MSLIFWIVDNGKLFNSGLFDGGLFYSANREIFHAPLTTTTSSINGQFRSNIYAQHHRVRHRFRRDYPHCENRRSARFEARVSREFIRKLETLATQGVSVDAGAYTVSFTGTGDYDFPALIPGRWSGLGT